MRREVADRSRAGLFGAEAPRVEAGIVGPVLEVAGAEVSDLAELARLDHLAREPDRRHEAVVEAAQVLDAGRRDLSTRSRTLRRASRPSGFSQSTCLPGQGGGDGRLGVDAVGSAVVEEPDPRVGDELPPVGRPALVAVAQRRVRDRGLVAAGDHRPAAAASGGGQTRCRTFSNALECAFPMKA